MNELSDVLGHPEAQQMLLAKRDLQVALERIDPPSSRFTEALMKAAKQCEDAMAVSGAYDGDATLLGVAKNMGRTVDGLIIVMQNRSPEKDA